MAAGEWANMCRRSSMFGTADVDLDRGQASDGGQQCRGLGEVVDPLAPDAHHGAGAGRVQPGQVVADPRLDARTLEPDAVEHAGTGLVHPGRRVARPRVDRERLDHHGAQRGERAVGLELVGVPGGARRRHHRVREGRASRPGRSGRRRPGWRPATPGPPGPVARRVRPRPLTGSPLVVLLQGPDRQRVADPVGDAGGGGLGGGHRGEARAPDGPARRPGCAVRRPGARGPGGC